MANKPRPRLDLVDAHVYGGTIFLAIGAAFVHIGAGLAVFGGVLLALGLRRPA